MVIPFSRNIRTANLTVNAGTILFDESTKVRHVICIIISGLMFAGEDCQMDCGEAIFR